MTPVERVRGALAEAGVAAGFREFDESTATAGEAAAAVGCDAGQIVKSLFFLADGRPTLVLVAGDREADTAKVATIVGVGRKRLKMGTPEQVREYTGFDVGGVAPAGHLSPCDLVVDDSLRRFECVWASAGTPHALFESRVADLVEALGGQWAAITRTP